MNQQEPSKIDYRNIAIKTVLWICLFFSAWFAYESYRSTSNLKKIEQEVDRIERETYRLLGR